MKNIPYLKAVGSIMYLAMATPPDMRYAAGTLARFSSNPRLEHWTVVKHFLCYLQGTANHAHTYSLDYMTNESFMTFSDANHGRCKDSGRSTSGYILKIGTRAVIWSSKLQGIVTLSSTKVEYSTTIEAGTEICWMRSLLLEISFKNNTPSSLHIDNKSTIQVAKDPEHHV